MIQLGVQLFTLRGEMKKRPIKEVFEFVKQTGATTVQLSALPQNITAEEILEAKNATGISICSTHVPFDRMKNDLDNVIREHKLYGCESAGLSMIPFSYDRNSKDAIQTFCREMNEISAKLRAEGISLHYHNHAYEFRMLDGKPLFETLMENFDSSILFSLDIFWLKVGKQNIEEYISRIGAEGRLLQIHMKDLKKVGFLTTMRAVGSGTLPYAEKYIPLAEKNGAKNALVEVDVSFNPKKTVEKSMKYLLEKFWR